MAKPEQWYASNTNPKTDTVIADGLGIDLHEYQSMESIDRRLAAVSKTDMEFQIFFQEHGKVEPISSRCSAKYLIENEDKSKESPEISYKKLVEEINPLLENVQPNFSEKPGFTIRIQGIGTVIKTRGSLNTALDDIAANGRRVVKVDVCLVPNGKRVVSTSFDREVVKRPTRQQKSDDTVHNIPDEDMQMGDEASHFPPELDHSSAMQRVTLNKDMKMDNPLMETGESSTPRTEIIILSDDDEESDDEEECGTSSTLASDLDVAVDPHEIVDQMYELTTELVAKQGAGLQATRATREEWEQASDTFDIALDAMLQCVKESGSRRMALPQSLGLAPDFELMPHQIVGADVNHRLVFGAYRTSILADMMGLGKTIQILCTYHLNLSLVVQKHHGKPWSPMVPNLQNDSRKFKERTITPGATFVSAHSSGIKVWARDWVRMFRDSRMLTELPEEYRPKLVILHETGPELAREFGGEKIGIHSSLSKQEWSCIFRKADWNDRSRVRSVYYQQQVDEEDGNVTWIDEEPKCGGPNASQSRPDPTATRYFIVSTNESWKTRVWDVAQPHHADVREIRKETSHYDQNGKLPNAKQKRDIEKRARQKIHDNMKGGGDGRQPYQVTRKASTGWKSKAITMVSSTLSAAWIVIDEIHSAAGKDTITYSRIIDPFLDEGKARYRPSFTAITGSALANGISMTITFVSKVFIRKDDPVWMKITSDLVKKLKDEDPITLMHTWKKFQTLATRHSGVGLDSLVQGDKNMVNLLDIFGHIIRELFIARDYDSFDCTGQPLRLLDCTLKKEYLSLKYRPEAHQRLKVAEDMIQAAQNEAYTKAVQAWHEKNETGPKPLKPQADSVDRAAYHRARVLASFPNFIESAKKIDAQNSSQDIPRILDTTNPECSSLGTENEAITNTIAKPELIRQGWIFTHVDDLVKDSAKMEHIIETIHRIKGEKSTIPHPIDPGRSITYRSKYAIVSNIRLCKAILYAKLCCEFGKDHIAWVGDGADKNIEIARWRRVWDKDTDEVDDGVYILVAGLKMVCQSIDLVEGHYFEGLEPHQINAEATQFANRGYRIGQQADEVTVNWLIHEGSYVENLIWGRNRKKDEFAAQCKMVKEVEKEYVDV